MKETESIKKEIESLKGSKPEIYTRIVGYYRAVSNWNIGKQAEYKERKTFTTPLESTPSTDPVETYVFVKTVCPKCVPVKKYLESINNSQVTLINVDEDSSLVEKFNLMATPTLIVAQGNNILEKMVDANFIISYLQQVE
jgi:ribonucleoside-triphosphate reductase